MHPPRLLTTLATLGLTTLASAAALDTTTSASTNPNPSSTSSSSAAVTSTSAPDSTAGPQSIKEYIHTLQAKHAAANNSSNSNNNNATMSFGAASTKHVSGMKAFEVPHCCLDGCDWCSTKICGPGQFCSDWPYMSCCATIILWDTEKDEILDVFTTEGLTVNMVYD